MGAFVEVPICDPDGTPSGESVRIEEPPPDVWRLGPGSMLELRRFRELKRFGCGCIWEDRPPTSTSGNRTGVTPGGATLSDGSDVRVGSAVRLATGALRPVRLEQRHG